MMTIELTQGLVTKVDDADWAGLNQHRWHAHRDKRSGYFYAARHASRGAKVFMHRHLAGCEPFDGLAVDHDNHDTLDNRRKNLVVTNRVGVHSNRAKRQSPHGAGIYISAGRYAAQATLSGKHTYLGTFDTAEEAREARARAIACV